MKVMDELLWDDFELSRTKHGRPFIKTIHNEVYNGTFDFNISHSYPYIVLIASKNQQVGVDIEKSSNVKANTIQSLIIEFSPNEQKMVHNNCQLAGKLWCIKEAIVKHDGRGIPVMTEYEVQPDWYTIKKHGNVMTNYHITYTLLQNAFHLSYVSQQDQKNVITLLAETIITFALKENAK